MEEENRPQFNFKQHIPKRFGRSHSIRLIIYILGFAVALGLLIQKWNNSSTNKKKIDMLKYNKEIEIESNIETSK